MFLSFDPAKRAKTLAERGLDFADAGEVFAGETATIQDLRQNYGEDRYITSDGLVAGVWFWFGRCEATAGASYQ